MAVAVPFNSHSVQFPHNILRESNKMAATMDHPNTKPSLPSISSLIEAVKDQPQNGPDRSPTYDHQRKLSGGSTGQPTSPERPVMMGNGSPRSHPPPTPPLPGPSSFDFPRHSPPGNTSPNSSVHSQTAYYNHTSGSTNPENYAQRSAYPPIPEANQWSPTQEHSPTESRSPETNRAPPASYPEPPAEGSSYPGLAQQRPLPGDFPPPVQSQALPPIDPQMAPTWQHHHYYPPANPPAYPPPSERYVCPTCQKPFSRPSSLKIHTYSHTGEKPFKCKHEGCGKYFSVRSNMKRHEKGCHGGDGGSTGGSSPKA